MSHLPNVPGFILTERLGKGSYAVVYKAFSKANARQVVAIKCVEKSTLTKNATDNLITEIGLLKKLKHPFIVEMKDFQWDDKFIFIIMEYCSGDLSQFIRSSRTLPEAIVKRFLQQLAKALQFMRSHNICHMDLKPQNILLSSVENPILKLADFGFAQYMRSQDDASSLRGSPLYMAPEMLLCNKYDARVDLWSVGVILYECLFGQAPFLSKSFAELVEKIKNPKPIEVPYGVSISDTCRNLLESLLQRDPDKRLSYDQFFQHEFLDLEHMASPSCYPKAAKLFVDAVRHDEAKEYAEAAHLYCEALRYFIPAIHFEKDSNKKSLMRTKAREYVERAEYLRMLMKPQSFSSNTEIRNDHELHYEELYSSSMEHTYLQAALKIAKAAEELEFQEKYDKAMEKYYLALETLLPILSNEPKGHRKDLLSTAIQRWMEKAEAIKSYLSVSVASVKSEVSMNASENMTSSNLSEQCCLQ